MKTSRFPNPLNRLAVFRWLVAQEVARRGGSSEEQLTANAWTLGLRESTIPPAIGLAARQHVDAVLPQPVLPRPIPEPAPRRGRPKRPKRPKPVKVRPVPAAVLEKEWRVMHMRQVGHLRFKDIARRMGWGPDRVRNVYGRACRRRGMEIVQTLTSGEPPTGRSTARNQRRPVPRLG